MCPQCGGRLVFRGGDTAAEIRWLLLGGHEGPARAAVPIPRGVRLALGSKPSCWLTLPGDGVGVRHADIMLGEDNKLRVWHVGGDSGTWINTARIHEGVLGEEDELLIGPYKITVAAGLPNEPKKRDSRSPTLRVNELPEIEADEEAEPETPLQEPPGEDQPTARGRIVAAMAVSALALGYLGWWLVAPKFSKEMPSETYYRCPADGTVVRGGWNKGFPKCPQCGALCAGGLRYKAEKSDSAVPASAPAPAPGAQPQPKDQGP